MLFLQILLPNATFLILDAYSLKVTHHIAYAKNLSLSGVIPNPVVYASAFGAEQPTSAVPVGCQKTENGYHSVLHSMRDVPKHHSQSPETRQGR
jgi:hypothetical protein